MVQRPLDPLALAYVLDRAKNLRVAARGVRGVRCVNYAVAAQGRPSGVLRSGSGFQRRAQSHAVLFEAADGGQDFFPVFGGEIDAGAAMIDAFIGRAEGGIAPEDANTS